MTDTSLSLAHGGRTGGWRVVAGSSVGIAFGSIVFVTSGFSQLAHAWTADLGWLQKDIAVAATIYLVLQMLTYPVVGRLLDRYGSRRVAATSIVLFALSLLLLSRIGGTLRGLYIGFGLIGLLTAGTNSVSYARAISFHFDRRRGFALGVAAASQAVGAVLMPVLGARLIATHGWSAAVAGFGVWELIVCLPLVWLLVRDGPRLVTVPSTMAATTARPVATSAPVSHLHVLRSPVFWMMALAFAIMGFTAYSLSVNAVFILSQIAHLEARQVATLQACSGGAVLVGRLCFGLLLDRMATPWVGLLSVLMYAAGIALYATGGDHFPLLVVAALLLGASIGGESDLMPYLASRYFGLPAVSTVLGWFLSAFFVGAAIGPTAFAAAASAWHSALAPLFGLLALQVVPAALMLTLGRVKPRFG